MVVIRPAQKKDLDLMVRIDLEDEGVAPGYREAWGDREALEHRQLIQSFIEADGARFAEAPDGVLIGVIMWRHRNVNTEVLPPDHVFLAIRSCLPSDGPFSEIFQLWGDPAYRRRGIGTSLKLAAEAHAKERGVKLIYTHTEDRNLHVIELNEKLGYREVRRGPIWDSVIRVSLVKDL